MSKREHLCQQELETYGKFHHILNNAASGAHNIETANHVKTNQFKKTFDNIVVHMMKAESGDELLANYKKFKYLLDKEKEAGHINANIHQALLGPVETLKSQRAPYLSKPIEKQQNFRKNAWIVGGTALITAALALTVVGAPLIPAAVVGGAALAYGVADQANELSEHVKEASNEALATMHHHNFDGFKAKLDKGEIDKEHKLDVKAYVEPTASANKHPIPKKSNPHKKLKTAAKILGMAGLGLAVAAMIAVFPPVGIPIAAGIGIGIASTAVIAATGGVVVASQMKAKEHHKTLTAKHEEHTATLTKDLDNTFSESIKQTQAAQTQQASKPVIQQDIEETNTQASDHTLTKPRPASPTSVANVDEIEANVQRFKEEVRHDASETKAMFEEMDATLAHGDLAKVVHAPEPLKQVAANTEQQPGMDDDEDESEHEGMHM